MNPITTPKIRRKCSEARRWLVIGGGGEREEVDAGRALVMRRTGLTAHELRIVEASASASASYSWTVVGREKAIVIKMEAIKAIITAHEIMILNSTDPSVMPFVDHLHACILRHNQFTQLQEDGMKILPFEFVALEACLEATCTALENEEKILKQEANTALNNLASDITTLNLERVRHIKSRLVAITGRAQKVKVELENLLDNDEDMSEMYLTNKLVQKPLETFSTSSIIDGDYFKQNQVLQPDVNGRAPTEISLDPSGGGGSHVHDHQLQNAAADYSRGQMFGGSHETYASTPCRAVTKKPDVEELEKLLEAYFAQINGILNKLFSLKEQVEDTEYYINILLDENLNKLLQMTVKLNTLIVIVEAFMTVTAILSINIDNELFKINGRYFWVMGSCTVTSILLYMVAIAWYKRKRLVD